MSGPVTQDFARTWLADMARGMYDLARGASMHVEAAMFDAAHDMLREDAEAADPGFGLAFQPCQPGGWRLVPKHIREGLDRHISRGEVTGGFLTALLENNLSAAILQADDINARRLRDIVLFLENEAPEGCWGSEAQVEAWRKRGGLAGRPEAA